jgi:hypothetical protein
MVVSYQLADSLCHLIDVLADSFLQLWVRFNHKEVVIVEQPRLRELICKWLTHLHSVARSQLAVRHFSKWLGKALKLDFELLLCDLGLEKHLHISKT